MVYAFFTWYYSTREDTVIVVTIKKIIRLRIYMSKKFVKIVIPLCMALGVFCLWYLNNEQTTKPTVAVQNTANADPVYDLIATNIDLEELKKHGVPIIIDFGADACVPCKAMAPVLVKLNAEMRSKAIIKFVDVWKNPQASKGFPVQVIPTQIIFTADGSPYVPEDTDIPFTQYSTKGSDKHAFTAHQGGLTEDQMREILEELGVE